MISISTLNPNELWYIIGYIVADGNLSKDKRHISIVSKDIEHLYKINASLELKCLPKMKSNGKNKNKIYGDLQFSDVTFYRYLQSIGLGPNKSLVLGPVKITSEFFSDFLRGVIDGDGSIQSWKHSQNAHVQWILKIVSGSKELAYWLHTEIEKRYSVTGKVHVRKNNVKNPIYIIKFGKLACQRIIKEIYYTDCLCLERKLKLVHLCDIAQNKRLLN